MLLISFEVSKYLSYLQLAASQSILFTLMRACLTPKGLINLECCLICPWISPALWLSLGNGSGETAAYWNHDKCCAYLQRVSGHVLDEIRCLAATMMV